MYVSYYGDSPRGPSRRLLRCVGDRRCGLPLCGEHLVVLTSTLRTAGKGVEWFLLKSGVFFPQTYSPYSDLFARYSRRLAYSQGELIPNAIHFYSSFYSCYSLVAE